MDAGCEMTKQFAIQFCFGLLAFSSAMEKMRAKVMEPLMTGVERHKKMFVGDSQKKCGVDEGFKKVAQSFYGKSESIVDKCKYKIAKLATQWWLCTIGAAAALLVMITGLYITYWWLIPLTLFPFLWFWVASWCYARSAKKAINQQRDGLETAWEGHSKKTEDAEDDILQKFSDSP